jgi:hypothetical protein
VDPRPSIALNYPFSPRSEVIVGSALPIAISPEGIVANSSFTMRPMRGEFISFEQMLQIEVEQRRLLINGVQYVTAATEVQAANLANFLQIAKRTNSKDRASKIESFIAQSLNSESAGSRLEEFADKTADLRLDSFGLLIVVFLISPFLVWKWKLVATWPFLLTYLMVNVAFIAWDFHIANRELFPKIRIARWSTIAIIVLSPPAALRAVKYLARDIGSDFHPLAFAAYRCSHDGFRDLASWVLRDLTFGSELSPGSDERAADCTTWFRHIFSSAVLSLVHRHGDDPKELTAPPPRESKHVRSYCPRCLSQFVVSDGVCSDCGRISLRQFDSESTERPHSSSTP